METTNGGTEPGARADGAGPGDHGTDAPGGEAERGAAGERARRAPTAAEAFRAQLRLLFRRRWSLAVLAALVALPMTVLAASTHGAPGVVLSDLIAGTWIWPAVLSAAWPMAVAWKDDVPSERTYPWTLPVDRSRLHLVRTAAGWVHLVAGLAAGIALGWATGASIHDGLAPGSGAVLAAVVPAATVLYLVGTLPALLTDRPLLWLFVSYVAVAALEGLAMTRGWDALATVLAEVFTGGPLSLNAAGVLPQAVSGALGGSSVAGSPWPAAALWLAVTAALTVGAARIHQERAGGS